MNCINFNGNKRFTSVLNKNTVFDRTYKKFSYTGLVKDFLQNIENIFKDIDPHGETIELYQKRKICFDIEICSCRIQKHPVEPHYISVYFPNILVRNNLRKHKFQLLFPENWRPLTENHYMGVFSFTRSEPRKTRLVRYGNEKMYPKMKKIEKTKVMKVMSHDIYKIDEEPEDMEKY